jgi:hypothetical protein
MARPRKRAATELSAFLDALLARRGLTHNEFSAKIGISSASLSDFKLREAGRAPTRREIEPWVEVLRLSPAEADELFDKIQLAHTPPYVQGLVRELRAGKRAAEDRRDYDASGAPVLEQQDQDPDRPSPRR